MTRNEVDARSSLGNASALRPTQKLKVLGKICQCFTSFVSHWDDSYSLEVCPSGGIIQDLEGLRGTLSILRWPNEILTGDWCSWLKAVASGSSNALPWNYCLNSQNV